MKKRVLIPVVFLLLAVAAYVVIRQSGTAEMPLDRVTGASPVIGPPDKPLVPTIAPAKAVGWKAGEAPVAASGLRVAPFADGLDHPRWLLLLPNGDVLAAESDAPPRPKDQEGIKGKIQSMVMKFAGSGKRPSANRITLLRDSDGDGIADMRSPLLTALNSPFGIALVGDRLYVAEAGRLVRFPYKAGDTGITAPPEKVVDLPGGPINHHWTKNVVANADGSKLYVTIGSNSNIAERGMAAEEGRAAIWEVDAKTGDHRIYAAGLRNPVGLAWEPTSGDLWTVVNERDELGSDIVPDYLTSVDFGGFYGWPWFYWGGFIDERVEPRNDEMQQYVRRPDYALGPHVAALGLSFAKGAALGPRFAEGAFIGLHGSWNRKPKSGYKVVFVPFAKGKPAGKPVDVLTGFLDPDERARGRPAGVILDKSGALLVADDVGGRIWRVSAAAPRP